MKNVTFYQIVYYQRGLRYVDHWKIVKLYIFVLKNFCLWKSVQTGHCIGDNGFRNSSNSKKIRTKLCKINEDSCLRIGLRAGCFDSTRCRFTQFGRIDLKTRILMLLSWFFEELLTELKNFHFG